MSKYYATFALTIAVFLPVVILVPKAHADGTCYAPVPVSCATLSASQCTQQEAVYQSEADIYNTCIANSYATDKQNTANAAKIRTICAGSNSQSCIASYDACQSGAPTNGFGSPDGASCTYTCNTGYYLDISGLCDSQSVPVTPTPTPVATPTPVVVATPTPVTTPANPVTVTQTVVTQSVTSTVPATKPKNIFTQLVQAVAPKPVTVTSAETVSETASATTSTPVTVQPVAQPTTKPTSFWSGVASFLKKLNPFSWF